MEERIIQELMETVSEASQSTIDYITHFSMNISKSIIMIFCLSILSTFHRFYCLLNRIFHYMKHLEEACILKDYKKQRISLQNSFNVFNWFHWITCRKYKNCCVLFKTIYSVFCRFLCLLGFIVLRNVLNRELLKKMKEFYCINSSLRILQN